MNEEVMERWVRFQFTLVQLSAFAGPVWAFLTGTWWGLFVVPVPFVTTQLALFGLNIALGLNVPGYGEAWHEVYNRIMKERKDAEKAAEKADEEK